MTEPEPVVRVVRCSDCHGTFLPRTSPCPRCGALALESGEISARGVVLAATELWAPPEGWSAPHRLILVECPELVRVLAWTSDELPRAGDVVWVVDHGSGAYRLRNRAPTSPP